MVQVVDGTAENSTLAELMQYLTICGVNIKQSNGKDQPTLPITKHSVKGCRNNNSLDNHASEKSLTHKLCLIMVQNIEGLVYCVQHKKSECDGMSTDHDSTVCKRHEYSQEA